MADLVIPLVLLVSFGATFAGLPWLAARVRRRGSGAEFFGPFEEIWYPAAARTRVEIQVQQERRAPAPTPGDPPLRG
ncbi:hypothetical protein [Allokutzneria sp. NRRL B-24872]|uniref:hypothetical protein n=1 Tax=Allokutzneria sp. NRRL B-24872 TaxID=1137961 RepID=UPI001FEFC702|nr:hypothetical protein [Allokutzneria sp. NRRL B-24872]